MRYFIVTLLLLAAPAICSAEIYKWVDEKGQIGFADDLGKVPKKYRDNAVIIEKQEQAVEIVEKSEAGKGGTQRDRHQKRTRLMTKGKGRQSHSLAARMARHGSRSSPDRRMTIKSLEEQAVGIKERMADGSKISRGEYLTLQNTQRDLEVRIAKAKTET